MVPPPTAVPRRSVPIERLFAGLGVVAFVTTDDPDPDDLLPAERALAAGWAIGRRRQFAAGRLCARAGLRRLGLADHPLLVGADRRPTWPDGAFGSISHTGGCAVAVVALTDSLGPWRFGIDVERLGRVHAGLHGRVFTDGERSSLAAATDAAAADRQATAVFSAKEALYKAQFAVTGAWVGFGDVSVDVEGDRGTAHPRTDRPALGRIRWPIAVSFTSDTDLVVAGVVLRAADG